MEPHEGFSNVGPNSRGGLLSLDRGEAEKVLELYIKRSLSSCETRTRKCEVAADVGSRRPGKKTKKLQRSVSDYSRYMGRRHAGAVQHKNLPLARVDMITERSDVRTDQRNLLDKDLSEEDGPNSGADKAVQKTKSGRPQQSWFKNILNFFTRRKNDENIDNSKVSSRESNGKQAPGCMGQGPAVGSSADLCTSHQGPIKSNKKKSSLKKVFSFMKNSTEEEKKIGLVDPDIKSKRPNDLPLQHICEPQTAGTRGKEFYYKRVSVEIEQIVKQKELQEDKTRKPSFKGELDYEDKEALIRKIASMLQKKGDEWDKKIKEDPHLSTFFKDISYTSFKKLADIYVDKEINTKVADVSPEEVKFAFTVHLTAKVAAICNHPVSRIMGFGSQYLQDTFAQLRYSKKGWDNDKVERELCQSPD